MNEDAITSICRGIVLVLIGWVMSFPVALVSILLWYLFANSDTDPRILLVGAALVVTAISVYIEHDWYYSANPEKRDKK